MFLVSLRHVNQARGFQDIGATGILDFFLFFFQKQILSNQLIQRPLTHTFPVIPVPIVAEDGYSCPNGTPTATICPLLSCLYGELWASYTDRLPSKIHPRLLRRVDANSC